MKPSPVISRLVDGRFGPILNVRSQRLGGSEPRWWLSTAQLARTPPGTLYEADQPSGAGTSLDAAEASARAFGEAVERYCALTATVEPVTATLRDSAFLEAWPRCAEAEQAPMHFTAPPLDTPLLSVLLRRLSDDVELPVPAGHVLLRYVSNTEPTVTIPISTGLAFHPDLVRAIWAALCEVVERDAVMSFWWIHRPTRKIDLQDAPQSLVERAHRLLDCRMTPHLFDVTTEMNVPTVFCILTAPSYPRLVVGAAAKASAQEACAKALDEVVSMRVALRAQPSPRRAVDPTSRPRTLIDHAMYYATDPDHPAFHDIMEAADTVPFSVFAGRSLPAPQDMPALRQIAARLERNGATPLWIDLTTEELQATGYVVKVVIPELLPLSPLDDVRWLATPKLQQRAAKAMAQDIRFTPHPHPFA